MKRKNETYIELLEVAERARSSAYAPYSGISVGAALLTDDGEIFTGANIESSSYTPTVCAERVAFFTAVHKGYREFRAIAIVGGKEGESLTDFCPPCGVCRQVMAEFTSADFSVILYNGRDVKIDTLAEIFPESFTKSNLK